MLSPSVMEEVYQYALRAEEKIRKKQAFGRGKGVAKGRGQVTRRGRIPVDRDEASDSNQQDQVGRGHESRGGRPYQRGRGRGRGKDSVYRCYTCNKLIDPTSALIMKILDKEVTMLPKENMSKYQYQRWIMHLKLGRTFL